MVANVSDIAGLTGDTPAGEGGSESADGFLQELLGIAGMLPQMNVPTVPVSPTTFAAPATGIAADAASEEVAAVSTSAQRELPAWLSASLGDLPAMPADDAAMPAAAVGAAAIPRNFVVPAIDSADADVPVTVATTLGSNEVVPDVSAQPLPRSPDAKVMLASATPTSVPAQLDSRTPGPQVFTDMPTPEVTVAAAAADGSDTNDTTAPAGASTYDIGQMLANMRRFEREPARASKATAQPAPVATLQDADAARSGTLSAAPAQTAPAVDLLADIEFSFEDLAIASTVDTDTSAPTGKDINAAVSSASVQTAVASSDDVASPRTLHARLGSAEWKDQLGAQLNWMVENGKHSASLKLTPEHLGPVEVRIDLNQNQTSVWFSAANADTRTALEQALPRLRELLSEQGMSLNDAGVFREPPREQQRGWTGGAASSEFQDAGNAPAAIDARRPAGLLDAYA